MLKKIGYYYPFTVPGTISFGFILYLIGAGYTQKNPYALFLSFAGFFLLAVLIVVSRIQAYRLGKEQLIWDASAALYSGKDKSLQRFYTGSFRTWFFFRVHVRVRGRLKIGKGVFFRVIRESAFTGEGALEFPLWFQCSGTFNGKGLYCIKDVFGLVRARAGDAVPRVIPVQPSLLADESPVHIQISGGEDDTLPKKSSDEDKYYQREYMPGDRFRDINWKASSRIGEMFTRISPVNEEQTKLVLIDFRHFSNDPKFSRSHAVHMEYLKRWCVSFLWRVKSSQPEFQFIIYTGLGVLMVEDLKDIQRLSIGLSSLFYEHDPKVAKDLTGIGEVYVFTTPYDSGIGQSLQVYSGRRVRIFTTAFPPQMSTADNEDIFVLSIMKNSGMIHFPGAWALSGGNSSPAVRSGSSGPAGLSARRYVKGRLL